MAEYRECLEEQSKTEHHLRKEKRLNSCKISSEKKMILRCQVKAAKLQALVP